MKKVFVILALAAIFQTANAQVKSVQAARTAVESAQKAADDPKKNTKTATWLKLGQTLLDAYDATRGDGWIGASEQELILVMSNSKPLSEESVEVGGMKFKKASYATMDYYFNENGILQMIVTTKPIYDDVLERAIAAYAKAAELDPKGQKTEDIKVAADGIVSKFNDGAYSAYTFGDYAKASTLFEKAYEASKSIPFLSVNSEAAYNAAFTANMVGDLDRAKALFDKSIENGYEGEGGEAYAKIADILDRQGDKLGSKDVLEKAFLKFPQSQSILIGLINYYLSDSGNTDRLFELINIAKQNEPGNASLVYVEGNINKQLGNTEAALACYDKCSEISSNYEFGYIGKGILYYEKALEFQEKAQNEMDDNKWAELNKQFEEALKSCIEPFEKAFEISKDEAIKSNVAEYLKNACFRFRTESQEFMDKYEKYNAASAKE